MANIFAGLEKNKNNIQMNNGGNIFAGLEKTETPYERYRRQNFLNKDNGAGNDDEPGFFSGVKSGIAGVFGGQARWGEVNSPFGGETLGDIADYFDDVVQDNARTKFTNGPEFSLDYLTDSQGLRYDVGNTLGSGIALGAETAAGAAALAHSPLAAGAAAVGRAVPAAAKLWNSPIGKVVVGNVAQTPLEAISEGGNLVPELRQAGYSEDEIQEIANRAAALNIGGLGLSNLIQSYGATKILGLLRNGTGKLTAGELLKRGTMGAAGGAATNYFEEGMQSAIGDIAMGQPIDWEEARINAETGGVTGAVLGLGGGLGGAYLQNRNAQQNSQQQAAVNEKEAFINAIAGQESGGDYGAVNERTGAAGKYQIMPENWPAWSVEAGLPEGAPMTPENQEIVARFKLGQYYDKYGARDAAIAWYGGEGAINYSDEAKNRKQGNGNEPSINEYADSVMQRMGAGVGRRDLRSQYANENADTDRAIEAMNANTPAIRLPEREEMAFVQNEAADNEALNGYNDEEITANMAERINQNAGLNDEALEARAVNRGTWNEQQSRNTGTMHRQQPRAWSSQQRSAVTGTARNEYLDAIRNRNINTNIDRLNIENQQANANVRRELPDGAQRRITNRAADNLALENSNVERNLPKEYGQFKGQSTPAFRSLLQRTQAQRSAQQRNLNNAMRSSALNNLTNKAMSGDHSARQTFDKLRPEVRRGLLNRHIDRLAVQNMDAEADTAREALKAAQEQQEARECEQRAANKKEMLQTGEEYLRNSYDNPEEGAQQELRDAEAGIEQVLEPVLTQLREGMGNGVALVPTENEGRKIRMSNNAPWYSDFYKKYKRPPTKRELVDMARDIYTGKNSHGLPGWEVNAENEAEFRQNAETLRDLDDFVETYEKLAEKFAKEANGGRRSGKTEKGNNDENAAGRPVETQEANNQNAENEVNKKSVSVEENIANGRKAMQKVINTHEDVENAMYREDVGNIDFVWGTPGRGKNFKRGYGVSHIIAKRDSENGTGVETANKLVEVIAKGEITGRQEGLGESGEPRIKLGYDNYTAVLSMPNNDNTWLLTGFENNEKAVTSERGEGFDSSAPTAATPTLTRRDRDVTASISIVPQNTSESQQIAQENAQNGVQQAERMGRKQTPAPEEKAAENEPSEQAKGRIGEKFNVFDSSADDYAREVEISKIKKVKGDYYYGDSRNATLYKIDDLATGRSDELAAEIANEQRRIDEARAEKQERKAKAAGSTDKSLDEFTKELTPMQRGNLMKVLDKKLNYGEGEGVKTRAEHMRDVLKNGNFVTEKRDGKKLEYRVYDGKEESGTFELITKAEYDYYNWLKEQNAEAEKQTESKKQPAKTAASKAEPKAKIEDFGEKIGGARKDVYGAWKELMQKAEKADVEAVPISKSWPEPDYNKLIEEGANKSKVAFIRALRDAIPPKPRQAYRIKDWTKMVTSFRKAANTVMDESDGYKWKSAEQYLKDKSATLNTVVYDIIGRAKLYEEVGHKYSLKDISFGAHSYSVFKSERFEKPKTLWVVEQKTKATAFSNFPRMLAYGETEAEALQEFKKNYEQLMSRETKKPQVTFSLYFQQKDGEKEFCIGKKVGRNVVKLKGGFKTAKEASDYKDSHQDELVAMLEKIKEIPKERGDINRPRVGQDMRGGLDVTPEMFTEAFGFRGVEFGNYVENARRQQDLNNAYDALMDMAAILDINPKAISLNGELGLAFGARGKGGVNPASAHYEPDKVVINLTKMNGAGSLGHEWLHALDNMFGKSARSVMASNSPDVALRYFTDKGQLMGEMRPEIVDAFAGIKRAILKTDMYKRSQKLDETRSKPYWATMPEMYARAFEKYLIAKLNDQNASNDYLVNVLPESVYNQSAENYVDKDNTYPYPTDEEMPEIRAAFDKLFAAIEQVETDKGIMLREDMQNYTANDIIRVSEEYYQQALFDYPEIESSERVRKGVQKGIKATLDFGALPGEIDKTALEELRESEDSRQSGDDERNVEQHTRARRTDIDRLRYKIPRVSKTLGIGITRQLVNDGAFSLVGKKVRTSRQLAEYAQILRHPGYEKFHRVYVDKDGVIIGHETVSAMLPAESSILEGKNKAERLADFMRHEKVALDENVAKVYYIHNHPSGNPTPSNEDLIATEELLKREAADKFAGHIIIDTTKYTFINKSGKVVEKDIPDKKQVKYDVAGMPHKALGRYIDTPDAAARLVKTLDDESKTTVFYVDSKAKVRAVVQLPEGVNKLSTAGMNRYLRLLARRHYGTAAIISTMDNDVYKKLRTLVQNGRVLDVILTNERNLQRSGLNDLDAAGIEINRDGSFFGETSKAKGAQRLLEEQSEYGQLTPERAEKWRSKIADTFTNARNIVQNGNNFNVTLPNGNRITIDVVRGIALSDEAVQEARSAHGIDDGTEIVATGSNTMLDGNAVMQLLDTSDTGVLDHEVLHAAKRMGLTKKENAALNRIMPEEMQADDYRAWRSKRINSSSVGKLWQKIVDFAKKLQALLGFENRHNVYRKIESGEVWTRSGENEGSGSKLFSLFTKEEQDKWKQFGKDFKAKVQDALAGKIKGNSVINVCDTPLILKELGVPDLPIKIRAGIAANTTRNKNEANTPHAHGLTLDMLEQIPQAINEPLFIMKSATVPGDIVVFTEVKDASGRSIVVPLALHQDIGNKNFANVIKSIYGRNNEDLFITKQILDKNVLYANTEKSPEWLTGFRLQLPDLITKQSSLIENSIAEKIADVKDKEVNSNTQYSVEEVTPEQKAAKAFTNTERKTTWQGIKDWVKKQRTEFYRDWFDKNDSLHGLDEANAMALGRELAESEKVYNRVQTLPATAAGMGNALIEGDANSIAALNQRMGSKKLKPVTLQMVLENITRKEMDKKHPDYLKRSGFNNWVDAFGAYLGSIRLNEMLLLHDEAYNQQLKEWEAGGKKGKKPEYKPYMLPAGLTQQDLESVIKSAPPEFRKAANMYWQFNDNVLTVMEDAGLISTETHQLLNTKYKYYCPLMRDFSDTAAADSFIGGLSSSGRGIGNVSSMLKRISIEGSGRKVLNPLESTIKAVAVMANRAERNKVGQMAVEMAKKGGLDAAIQEVEGTVADPKNCIFTVMFNGKKQAFKTTQELYGPIVGYNLPSAGFVLGIARNAARLLRAGATSSPSFIIRNLIRDTIFAGISSKNGFVPIVDTIRGAYALAHDPRLRAEFKVAGVTQFNFYSSSEQIVKSLDQMAGGKAWNDLNMLDIGRAILKYPAMGSEFVESATRMGEFMKARKKGVSLEEAAQAARELTLDFSRSGVQGEKVNQIVPFFNAVLQGGDKMVRLFKNDPVGTSAKLAMYIVLPSLALWALNHDEDWYKELNPEIKATCWCLPGGIRIPKPQECGILFGSGIEAMLDAAINKDPDAIGNWAKVFGGNIAPNVLPTVFLPLIEWQANYSFFRGSSITPQRLQNLPDELQYTPTTSAAARTIGSIAGLSPVKIDNTIRGYTGTMGMFLVQQFDWFADDKQNMPYKKVSEWPFLRDFTVNQNIQNRSVDDFYKMLKEANEQHAGYGKKGKPTVAVKGVRAAGKLISEAQKDIRELTVNPRLSPEIKRQRIGAKKAYIKNVAKKANLRFGRFFED